MKLTISQSLAILELQSPFTMVELKKAYRSAALKSHPDCGGSNEEFILVDAAYDLLKTCASDSKQADNSYWATYWQSRLEELHNNFVKQWRDAFKTAQAEKTGLWLSTCIERFARAYMYPRTEWFVGVLFEESSFSNRTMYREILLGIAPNQRLREQWALKYYRLEFGYDTPYVFYLPPASPLSTTVCAYRTSASANGSKCDRSLCVGRERSRLNATPKCDRIANKNSLITYFTCLFCCNKQH